MLRKTLLVIPNVPHDGIPVALILPLTALLEIKAPRIELDFIFRKYSFSIVQILPVKSLVALIDS